MPIKARPFRVQISDAEVEGFFDCDTFVFTFYGMRFLPTVTGIDKDARGKFAILQDTEISYPDGWVLTVETHYDAELGSEWGYHVSLSRNETEDRKLLEESLKGEGVNIDSVILITPPRQLSSVYFNPHGVMDGSAYQPLESTGGNQQLEFEVVRESVRSSGAQQILFLSHAVRQMSRPDRMITTSEVRTVIASGEVIENYPDDPRGPSCLMLGYGATGRPIHLVCSPKPDFLAIITAYIPNEDEWSNDFRVRIKR
ncbi:MAG: hypothetical protein QOF62_471 [Pyrinomonadaceae bacterium]|jgi:hypothetical protein|nr:hypothetical protein [Pyrinomonadaceae bacterium]